MNPADGGRKEMLSCMRGWEELFCLSMSEQLFIIYMKMCI